MVKTKNTEHKFFKKYFTVSRAEMLLPVIEKILRRTVKLNKALELLESIEIEVRDDNYEDMGRVTKANKQFHKLSYEFYGNIERLEDMGCIVKDLDLGIIDFYCRFEDHDIFLCWMLGERKISFWHEIDSSYEGRKPILDLTKNR
jgi:hypothetical protein